MKKILCIILTVISIQVSKASSTDTIPNGNFESWRYTFWSEDPTFWMTNNSELLAPTVVKDSNSHSGYIAMMLAYQGVFQPQASCGFSISSHPYNLGGYVKNQMNTNDSTVISILIYYNQQIVDSGYIVMYGGINPGYTSFEVPISQNSIQADSCLIQFSVGMVFQSTISFDDLQFDFTSGVPENYLTKFSVHPNPCSDYAILKCRTRNFVPDNIEVYDIVGKRHQIPFDRNKADDYIVELNTSELGSGIWILVLSEGKNSYSTVLVKK